MFEKLKLSSFFLCHVQQLSLWHVKFINDTNECVCNYRKWAHINIFWCRKSSSIEDNENVLKPTLQNFIELLFKTENVRFSNYLKFSKTCVISVTKILTYAVRSSSKRIRSCRLFSQARGERKQRKSGRSFSPWHHRALYSLVSQREANWTREEAYGGGVLIARSRIAVNKRERRKRVGKEHGDGGPGWRK